MSWLKRLMGKEGNVKWKADFVELESFFNTISVVLEDFATTYNLMIEKYPHHGPEWSFIFKHPIDGTGQIEVERVDDTSILIRKSWWIDDFDTSVRFMKYPPPSQKIGLNHNGLRQVLEDALEDIIQWKKDELVPQKAPYPWSKRCSKKQFYEQYENLPELKV